MLNLGITQLDPLLVPRPADTDTVRTIDYIRTAWVDIENPDPDEDVLRLRGRDKGAAVFASGEGLLHRAGALLFACTNGGLRAEGQIWRYVPSPAEGTPGEKAEPGRLELLAQPDDAGVLHHPVQMTAAPGGDLLMCEDGDDENFVGGLTPAGAFYRFARMAAAVTEPAGPCFSPDRTTLFLNDLPSGLTFAITGPWK